MAPDEPAIVAAAAVARLTDESFGGSAALNGVNIVERYGATSADGMLDVGSGGPLIDAGVRTAVEDALAPVVVTWIEKLEDVMGTDQVPADEGDWVILRLSRPVIDGTRAVITTERYCGWDCGNGGALNLDKANSDQTRGGSPAPKVHNGWPDRIARPPTPSGPVLYRRLLRVLSRLSDCRRIVRSRPDG
jgi:hypothetical protein